MSLSSLSSPTLYTPSISSTTPSTTTTTTNTFTPTPSTPPFSFPPYHTSYPPFFTLQPTVPTRLAQLHKWSQLIQRYCAHHALFRLSTTSPATLDSPLFHNARLRRRLSAAHVREVVLWMVSKEGGARAEWVGGEERSSGGSVWVFWKRPEEWAEVLGGWVSLGGCSFAFFCGVCGFCLRGGFNGVCLRVWLRAESFARNWGFRLTCHDRWKRQDRRIRF